MPAATAQSGPQGRQADRQKLLVLTLSVCRSWPGARLAQPAERNGRIYIAGSAGGTCPTAAGKLRACTVSTCPAPVGHAGYSSVGRASDCRHFAVSRWSLARFRVAGTGCCTWQPVWVKADFCWPLPACDPAPSAHGAGALPLSGCHRQWPRSGDTTHAARGSPSEWVPASAALLLCVRAVGRC